MITKSKFAVMAGIVSLLFLTVLPGFAEEKAEEKQGKAVVSETELNQTAKAYAKIMEIQQGFQQSIQEAGDDRKKIQALQEDANKRMTKAVEKEGLDLQTYSKIIQTVKADADLRNDFMEKLEQIE
ncbi:MAG: DUF4168 domain-containing protein [Desulfatiglandaceae bacterium]